MSSMGPTTASTLASYSRTCSPERIATGCQGKPLGSSTGAQKWQATTHFLEHWQLPLQRTAVTTAVSSEQQRAAATAAPHLTQHRHQRFDILQVLNVPPQLAGQIAQVCIKGLRRWKMCGRLGTAQP